MTCVNYQLLRKGYQLSQKKKPLYINDTNTKIFKACFD